MPLTGTAIGATPGEGALPAAETTQRITRATERESQAAEAVTKADEMAARAPRKEICSNSSAGQPTPEDGVTHHTLYVDATAVGPRTPTHHAER